MKEVKLFTPFVSWKAMWNTIRVLRSGQLAEGEEVKKFENEFSKKFNVKNVVALNSGTSALDLAYTLADIQPTDEVITPVLTCTATNIPLIHKKAKIVFADTDYDLNINIEDVKRKITPKTKAIVFVHFGGNNRGLREIIALGKARGITIIEDAAQAMGSAYWGKSEYTCISLQAIKTLTTGDGGLLICKGDDDYNKARRLRWFGYDREEKQKKGDTDLVEAGYKYHMNNIAAAIGRGNLAHMDEIMSHIQLLQAVYRSYGITAYPWFATILTDEREALMNILAQAGIKTGIYHYRNDKYTIFGGRKSFPIMDEIESKYLLLPLHYKVSVQDVHRICKIVRGVILG